MHLYRIRALLLLCVVLCLCLELAGCKAQQDAATLTDSAAKTPKVATATSSPTPPELNGSQENKGEENKGEKSQEKIKQAEGGGELYQVWRDGDNLENICGAIDSKGNLIYDYKYLNVRYLPASHSVILQRLVKTDKGTGDETYEVIGDEGGEAVGDETGLDYRNNFDTLWAVGDTKGSVKTDYIYSNIFDIDDDFIVCERYGGGADVIRPSDGKVLMSFDASDGARVLQIDEDIFGISDDIYDPGVFFVYNVERIENGDTKPIISLEGLNVHYVAGEETRYREPLVKLGNGRFAILNRHGYYGVLDYEGNQLLPFCFGQIGNYGDGMYAIKTDISGEWGYCDESGSITLSPRYAVAGSFYDGGAVVLGVDPDGQHAIRKIDKSGGVHEELNNIGYWETINFSKENDFNLMRFSSEPRDNYLIVDKDLNLIDPVSIAEGMNDILIVGGHTLICSAEYGGSSHAGVYDLRAKKWIAPLDKYEFFSTIGIFEYEHYIVNDTHSTSPLLEKYYYQFARSDDYYYKDMYDYNGEYVGTITGYADNARPGMYKISRGFYSGYIDGENNWVYKDSVFYKTDDEVDDDFF